MSFRALLITPILITTVFTKTVAQNPTDLIGKWQTTYEDEGKNYVVIYEFKKITDKIQAYSIIIKDEKGNEIKDNSLAISEIELNNGKGTCVYSIEYKKELYEINSKLNLKDNNTLIISYSYWGFSDTEIWKRIDNK